MIGIRTCPTLKSAYRSGTVLESNQFPQSLLFNCKNKRYSTFCFDIDSDVVEITFSNSLILFYSHHLSIFAVDNSILYELPDKYLPALARRRRRRCCFDGIRRLCSLQRPRCPEFRFFDSKRLFLFFLSCQAKRYLLQN